MINQNLLTALKALGIDPSMPGVHAHARRALRANPNADPYVRASLQALALGRSIDQPMPLTLPTPLAPAAPPLGDITPQRFV